jgi:NADH-quinone oxidoreductase subunit C
VTDAEIALFLRDRLPAAVVSAGVEGVKEPAVDIRPESAREVLRFCRDEPSLSMDLLMMVSGADYPEAGQISVVWHLESSSRPSRVVLRTRVPRDDPRIASVADLWPAADWHERETFDLLGVRFEGHPDPRRILLPDDWVGHPLRKDYVPPESYHGIPASREYAEQRGIPLPQVEPFEFDV